MLIRSLIGLKILKLTFISGMAAAYALKKCCEAKDKGSKQKDIEPVKKKRKVETKNGKSI